MSSARTSLRPGTFERRHGRAGAVEKRIEVGVMPGDLEAGAERRRVPTTRPVTHGVVASPDGRWVFVSNEARGSTRSTVDVIDLEGLERVASVEVGLQAGGIDFWRIQRPRRIDDAPGPGRRPPGDRPPGP